MIKKIYRFCCSTNKKRIIKNKVQMLWQQLIRKRQFGSFGKNSILLSPDRIIGSKNIFIADHVGILKHARMEAISEYKEQTFSPRISIGKKTSIGQNLHMVACNEVVIGQEVTISGNVFISDCAHEYRELNRNSSDQPLVVRRTEIGDYCFIGYGAAIMSGVTLGKQCIVGANAVVLQGNYPDYCVLAGVPAKVVKKYSNENKEWESVK